MAVTSGFFNSKNGDRKYNSTQFSTLFDGILNDGIFASVGTSMVVQENTGMRVNVGVGRAWLNKTWIDNDAPFGVVLSASDITLNRIDAIVLEINAEERESSIKIVKGAASAVPDNPTIVNTENLTFLPLCYIYVAASATSIIQENITNLVGTPECPFITGMLQTMSVEGVSALLEAEFNIWFAEIQNKLSGDLAGALQLQIDAINVTKADVTEIQNSQRESYMAFVSNINANSLDAAFGKGGPSNIIGLGNQLRLYATYMGESQAQYPMPILSACSSVTDILENDDALIELYSSRYLYELMMLSPYAKGLFLTPLVEADFTRLFSKAMDLPSVPESFTDLITPTANINLMKTKSRAMRLLLGLTKHAFSPIGKIRAIPNSIATMNSNLVTLQTIGQGTYVVPAGKTSITVCVVGTGAPGRNGGGGACGGYNISNFKVSPGDQLSYDIGGKNKLSTPSNFMHVVALGGVGRTLYGNDQNLYLPNLSTNTEYYGNGGYGGGNGGGGSIGGLTFGTGGQGTAGRDFNSLTGGAGYGGGGQGDSGSVQYHGEGGQGVVGIYL